MVNTLRKYVLGFIAMLLFTACAKKTTFEWIKVNPEKVNVSTTSESYTATVRKVSILIDLKEKENTAYYNNSTGFFSENEPETKVNEAPKYKSPLKNNIAKSGIKQKIRASIPTSAKPYSKGVKHKSNKVVLDSPADKLNGALKLPMKPIGLKKPTGTLNQKKKGATFNSTASEIRAMAFNDIKTKNPEIEERSSVKAQKSKNLMWVGLILVVVGGILGVVMNKSAFLISLAGAVFAVIGYFIRF